ncbi:hypothetical protein WJX72_007446 [[Myrmecia] bisecta]|uniref:Uncharacterized protein n=1 Tax=[Myrmecia] bisecta TaxID=41462 RepID=A0AAW1R827_9CHLO
MKVAQRLRNVQRFQNTCLAGRPGTTVRALSTSALAQTSHQEILIEYENRNHESSWPYIHAMQVVAVDPAPLVDDLAQPAVPTEEADPHFNLQAAVLGNGDVVSQHEARAEALSGTTNCNAAQRDHSTASVPQQILEGLAGIANAARHIIPTPSKAQQGTAQQEGNIWEVPIYANYQQPRYCADEVLAAYRQREAATIVCSTHGRSLQAEKVRVRSRVGAVRGVKAMKAFEMPLDDELEPPAYTNYDQRRYGAREAGNTPRAAAFHSLAPAGRGAGPAGLAWVAAQHSTQQPAMREYHVGARSCGFFKRRPRCTRFATQAAKPGRSSSSSSSSSSSTSGSSSSSSDSGPDDNVKAEGDLGHRPRRVNTYFATQAALGILNEEKSTLPPSLYSTISDLSSASESDSADDSATPGHIAFSSPAGAPADPQLDFEAQTRPWPRAVFSSRPLHARPFSTSAAAAVRVAGTEATEAGTDRDPALAAMSEAANEAVRRGKQHAVRHGKRGGTHHTRGGRGNTSVDVQEGPNPVPFDNYMADGFTPMPAEFVKAVEEAACQDCGERDADHQYHPNKKAGSASASDDSKLQDRFAHSFVTSQAAHDAYQGSYVADTARAMQQMRNEGLRAGKTPEEIHEDLIHLAEEIAVEAVDFPEDIHRDLIALAEKMAVNPFSGVVLGPADEADPPTYLTIDELKELGLPIPPECDSDGQASDRIGRAAARQEAAKSAYGPSPGG